MHYGLLVLAQLVGLLLIPLGLPGVWLQVVSLAAFGWYTNFTTVSWWPILLVAVLAVVAETLEFTMGGRFTERYGGSRRAAWGAILGGLVGAVVGVPVFLIGSVIGAFVGAFAGAVLMELTLTRELRGAMRVGWGALIGRLVATVVKCGIGVAIAVISVFAAA
jgi:uncharacterized protein